jgi:hypothetical protein
MKKSLTFLGLIMKGKKHLPHFFKEKNAQTKAVFEMLIKICSM